MYTTATTTVGSLADPKFTVADILTSMASGGIDLPSPFSEASFMNSIPTGNTPTLTPTTLANIEQSFIELQSSVPVTIAPVDPSRQAGFVPPVVDPRATAATGMPVKTEYPDYYDLDDSESSMDKDWMPSVKRSRPDDGSQTSVISYAQTLNQSGPTTSTGAQRRTPGRRGKNDVLPPEEDAKRRLRRERNKLAAAKCRQRRVDHTNVLLGETEELEDKRASLESEIQQLQQQKEQLEFLLQAHKPVCTVVKLQIKAEPEEEMRDAASASSSVSSSVGGVDLARFSPSQSSVVVVTSAAATSRPNSLPLSVQNLTHSAAVQASSATTSTPSSSSLSSISRSGMMLSTPSNGLFPQLGLDSMRDGHTGLTPITGAPSGCAREVKRNSSDSSPSDGIASPTLMAL